MKKENFKNISVALIFKDFAAWIKASCVGLNVAGYTTAKYLREHGIDCTVFPVRHNVDVVDAIHKHNDTHKKKLTHVIISAPWLSLHDLKSLLTHFSNIQFVVLSHSNVGFLQADPCGVELLRKYAELAKTYPNIKVGGNSTRFVNWFRIAYNEDCVCLPNLYTVNENVKSKVWNGASSIKIGAFGALRPEKNFMTGAAAALAIHSMIDLPVELHMTTGGESQKSTTLNAIRQMTKDVEGFTLIEHPWETWDKFIKLIETMNLLIQVSYTESFNMITADGISVGVPSVVSPVISWAPNAWKADADDVIAVADVGLHLLLEDQHHLGSRHLNEHNERSLKYWMEFLNCKI